MSIRGILILICAVGMVVMINTPQHDELAQRQVMYCEMTRTFEKTNGRYGWPDYLGAAEEVCK